MADQQALTQAIKQAEIYRYIPKPWDNDELVALINAALTLYRTQEQERKYLDLFHIQKHRSDAERMMTEK